MNMTPTIFRRLSKRPFATIFLLVLCALGHIPHGLGATTADQVIDATRAFLEQAVEKYLSQARIDGRSEVEVNRLDPRLRLALCDAPLTTSLESPAQPLGRVTVRVQCVGSSPWTIFVPGQVRLYRQVVVASRPLPRLVLISATDVMLAERDVGQLPQGYFTDLQRTLGHKLARPVTADQVLAPSFLQQAEAVRKGERVMISARAGSTVVRVSGEALSDGAEGQQIRVRNQTSGRVVKARVIGPGQVQVDM